MRDSRVTIWTNPTTISADGTSYGTSIDLVGDYVGDHLEGTSLYGLPVEIMAYDVNTGTGDGFTVTVSYQLSEDNSTWVDFGQIGVFTIDTDGNFQRDDDTDSPLTRQKIGGRIKAGGDWAYARLKVVAAGITNSETVKIKAWLSDGTVTSNNGKHY